ncbi:hypothetical protein BVU76_22440 [Mycolicibacterium porcinum]|nr:hypothetical protein BVU76_22440 [Mycolicibacterium porcinum]
MLDAMCRTDFATEFAAEREIVARYDAGDTTVTIDAYDEAIEVLAEAGLLQMSVGAGSIPVCGRHRGDEQDYRARR